MNNISLFLSHHQIQLVKECHRRKFCFWLALLCLLLCSSSSMKESIVHICMTSPSA